MTFENKQWAAIFIGLTGIEAGLLYKLIAGQSPISPTVLIIAVCTFGILLLLSVKVESLRSISMTREGFEAKLDKLQTKTSENEKTLANVLLLSMGDDAYRNLRKLADGTFLEFEKPHYMGLETELYHLRNLGYVRLNEGNARSIFEIPEKGPRLLDYVSVTDKGRKYLELRDKYAPKG